LPSFHKNEEINKSTIFEQKLKCNELRASIESSIKDYNSQQKPKQESQNNELAVDDPQQTFGLYINAKELYDFFYSSKLNTCVYVEIMRTSLKTSGDSELGGHIEYWKPVYEYYNFIDALTGTTIDSVRTISRGEIFDDFKNVKSKIDSFKN